MASLSKLYTTKQITAIRDELIAKHGNNCSICKKPRSAFKKNLSVDHRHSDNKIRGLLCFHDNRYKVGRFELHTILPVLQYLVKFELEGDLCEKYGKILQDMSEDIKSVAPVKLKASKGRR